MYIHISAAYDYMFGHTRRWFYHAWTQECMLCLCMNLGDMPYSGPSEHGWQYTSYRRTYKDENMWMFRWPCSPSESCPTFTPSPPSTCAWRRPLPAPPTPGWTWSCDLIWPMESNSVPFPRVGVRENYTLVLLFLEFQTFVMRRTSPR